MAMRRVVCWLALASGLALDQRAVPTVSAAAPFSFLALTCAVGAERMLKEEQAAQRPELRPAFQRPGLVTFKSPTPLSPLHLRAQSCLARHAGVSLGSAASASAAAQLARGLGLPPHALTLHVFARGEPEPAASHPDARAARAAAVSAARAAILSADRTLWAEASPAATVQHTLSVAVPSGSFAAEPWHVSYAAHNRFAPLASAAAAAASSSSTSPFSSTSGASIRKSRLEAQADEGKAPGDGVFRRGIFWGRLGEAPPRDPGGLPGLTLPPGKPSRAYLKMREALHWSRLPVRQGDLAVEVFSAVS